CRIQMPILKEPSYLIFIVSNFLGTAHVRRAFLLEKVKLYIDFNKARWQALQWVRKIIIGE
ncbi:MAG: hypothetical protein UC390_11555, partial [Peptococcaceae bacterium]|nr:hypothetical protein [Peptococcaceae bacterium]